MSGRYANPIFRASSLPSDETARLMNKMSGPPLTGRGWRVGKGRRRRGEERLAEREQTLLEEPEGRKES